MSTRTPVSGAQSERAPTTATSSSNGTPWVTAACAAPAVTSERFKSSSTKNGPSVMAGESTHTPIASSSRRRVIMANSFLLRWMLHRSAASDNPKQPRPTAHGLALWPHGPHGLLAPRARERGLRSRDHEIGDGLSAPVGAARAEPDVPGARGAEDPQHRRHRD